MSPTLTFGSLFAGIGGMDLGLERAGMKCVWQVEIDEYCKRVLAKHWPNVKRWDDVRTFPPNDGDWQCDLIAGGFPCQDISTAGKQAGIEGKRSGLWSEFARIIRILRPGFVLVENVAALLDRGLGRVLGDLAESGYCSEWSLLSACEMGAPHMRQRMFVVAYNDEIRFGNKAEHRTKQHAFFHGPFQDRTKKKDWWGDSKPDRSNAPEPELCGMVNGIPNRMDRLSGLGNAVVPQVAEWIGKRILASI